MMGSQSQQKPARPEGQESKGRILIVEDDRDTMNWLSILLRQNHFEVFGAGDGTQGMNVAVRERPDLVILDIGLPAGNGIFVLESIRRHQQLQLTPVVVCSGAPAFRPQEAIDAGATSFLPKPCSNESILNAVEEGLLAGKQLREEAEAKLQEDQKSMPSEAPVPPFG
jgi:two-component system KDP operon response regulator KdpE